MPSPPSSERSWRSTLAAGALGLTVGLGAWALLGAYTENSAGFFGSCLLLAGVFGVLAPRSAVPFGATLVLGVVPLSLFTAHQGDGDGLWILIVPTIALFGLLTTATAAVTARLMGPRVRADDPVTRFVGDRVALVCVACVGLSALLVAMTMRAYPDPWPEFEAVLQPATPPEDFADLGITRMGSPLQVGGGAPVLQRLFASPRPPAETCDALHDVLTAWSDDRIDWDPPSSATGYLCGGSGTVQHAGDTYRVSASAWVTATGELRADLLVHSPHE